MYRRFLNWLMDKLAIPLHWIVVKIKRFQDRRLTNEFEYKQQDDFMQFNGLDNLLGRNPNPLDEDAKCKTELYFVNEEACLGTSFLDAKRILKALHCDFCGNPDVKRARLNIIDEATIEVAYCPECKSVTQLFSLN